MKRTLTRILPAVVGLLAFGAALMPWTLPDASVHRGIAPQIAALTGLELLDGGARAELTILPSPAIRIRGLRLASSDGSLSAQIAAVRGSLRLLPLLGGRIELASLTATEPQFRLDLDRLMKWPIAAAPEKAAVVIERGTLRLLSSARGIDRTIGSINVALDWPGLASPASLTMSAVADGQRLVLDGWMSRPARLKYGQGSGLTLRLQAAASNLMFDGDVFGGDSPRLDGRLSVSAAGLRGLLDQAGIALPLPGPLARFSAQGRLTASTTISLSEARLSIDGNDYEGSISFARSESRAVLISGTLAANTLDISGWAPPSQAGAAHWTAQPVGVPLRNAADLDLRLSAAKVVAGPVQTEAAALAVMLKSGRLEVNVVDLAAYSGRLKGRFTLAPPRTRETDAFAGPDRPAWRAVATISGLDLDALPVRASRFRLGGRLTGQMTMEGAGETPAEVLADLAGRAQLTVSDGEFSGLDLRQALENAASRPLRLALDMQRGVTPFERLSGQVHIAAGQADLVDAAVKGPGFTGVLTGRAGLTNGLLNASVRIRKDETSPELPLELSGSLASPVLRLDAEAILRRVTGPR